MKKGKYKEPEVTLGRTFKEEDDQIQLSGENIRFIESINKVDKRLDKLLFIVPWQQID